MDRQLIERAKYPAQAAERIRAFDPVRLGRIRSSAKIPMPAIQPRKPRAQARATASAG
jgi:hypothetical protein